MRGIKCREHYHGRRGTNFKHVKEVINQRARMLSPLLEKKKKNIWSCIHYTLRLMDSNVSLSFLHAFHDKSFIFRLFFSLKIVSIVYHFRRIFILDCYIFYKFAFG